MSKMTHLPEQISERLHPPQTLFFISSFFVSSLLTTNPRCAAREQVVWGPPQLLISCNLTSYFSPPPCVEEIFFLLLPFVRWDHWPFPRNVRLSAATSFACRTPMCLYFGLHSPTFAWSPFWRSPRRVSTLVLFLSVGFPRVCTRLELFSPYDVEPRQGFFFSRTPSLGRAPGTRSPLTVLSIPTPPEPSRPSLFVPGYAHGLFPSRDVLRKSY